MAFIGEGFSSVKIALKMHRFVKIGDENRMSKYTPPFIFLMEISETKKPKVVVNGYFDLWLDVVISSSIWPLKKLKMDSSPLTTGSVCAFG